MTMTSHLNPNPKIKESKRKNKIENNKKLK